LESEACIFLTNHSFVLLCIADDPEVRLRDMAVRVGITERSAHRIVSELEEMGYVTREREGRRNSYRIATKRPLRHPLADRRPLGELVALLNGGPPKQKRRSSARSSGGARKP
jgi:DNA-binding transcriptional ArsR family regulator